MKKKYEKPEIHSFQAELCLLYTSCRQANQDPPGPMTCQGCPDGGCSETGTSQSWSECVC